MRHICSLLVLALTAFIPACGPLGNLTPPEVQLVNVRPGTVSVFQSQGDVILTVVNSNSQPITITGATYELILDQTHVGRAMSTERLEVPADSAADQHCTLYITDLNMLDRLKVLLAQPKLTYTLRGTVAITLADGRSGSVPTETLGELSAKTE